MNDNNLIQGMEFMGEKLRSKLKFCGEDVRLYPLCKMIRAENAELDNNCQLFDYVFIDAGKSLKIGKYSTLTWHVLVEGGAQTKIGDRVFLGPGTKLLTSTYKINGCYTVEHLPQGCQETHYGNIEIDDDAYLGASVTVMPGVTIGKGAVAGANALVTKDLEPWTIYVGPFCKPVGKRERPAEERRIKLQEVNWSNHL